MQRQLGQSARLMLIVPWLPGGMQPTAGSAYIAASCGQREQMHNTMPVAVSFHPQQTNSKIYATNPTADAARCRVHGR